MAYSLSIGDSLKGGWQAFIKKPLLAIYGALILSVSNLVPMFVPSIISGVSDQPVGIRQGDPIASLWLFGMAILLLPAVFGGFELLVLKITRGERAGVSYMLAGFSRYLEYMGLYALFFAPTFATMLLVLVFGATRGGTFYSGSISDPLLITILSVGTIGGIIWAIMFLRYKPAAILLVEHRELSFKDALKRSRRMVEGNHARYVVVNVLGYVVGGVAGAILSLLLPKFASGLLTFEQPSALSLYLVVTVITGAPMWLGEFAAVDAYEKLRVRLEQLDSGAKS